MIGILLGTHAAVLPHGYCYLWQPGLIWLHAVSDTLIAAAYMTIPLTLLYFMRRRQDLPFSWMFVCFAVFIVACGVTHALGVYNIWVPTWWLTGGVKAVTAAASVPTAILLGRLVPQAIALPSPAQLAIANDQLEQANGELEAAVQQLQAANARLATEVADRERAESALARAHHDCELLVEQRTAELADVVAALRQSEARYRSLIETTSEIIWDTDADGRPRADQMSWARFTGQPAGTTQVAWADVVHPDDRELTLHAWQRALESESLFAVEHRLRRSDGEYRWMSVRAAPVRERDGRVKEWIGVHADIHERRVAEEHLQRLQRQLLQAQRMEAVGRLAGGVAHDFNNLLTVIHGTSVLLARSLPKDGPQRQDIEAIRSAAERAGALTAQLLAFSRRQVLQPRVFELNTVVREIDGLLRRIIGEDVELHTVLGDDVGQLLADPTQLEQVLVNLAVNARDAMPSGGRLTIETSRVVLDPAYATEHIGVDAGAYALLAVSDTGVGMDAVTRAQIFEPFFTTKPVGQGTGLGLATVFGIVKQSGGSISVYSEVGKGATFRIFLPLTDQLASERIVDTGAPAEPLGGSETILLTEDSGDVRLFAARVLRGAGYEVLEAASGAEAEALTRARRGVIHVLLTDVVMPAMTGRELASRLLRLRPGIAVLYMSGYTDNAIVHHGVLDPGTAFLQKPFTPTDLIRKLREVIDSAARAAPRAGR